MKNTLRLSIAASLLLTTIHAEEVLEPIIITSTAIETNELQAADAIEVYTAQEIEKAHVQNVYEFLNKATSVFATNAYGNPFIQNIDMRGFGVGDGYQNIVVTINGRKMNNIDMVPQLLSSISPSSIEKIEIIKSSGIVLGGDGANAGAINIITKQSNDKELTFYAGNYGLIDGAFYVGHADEKISINLSGETQKSDGIRDIDTNGNKDENRFSTLTLNIAFNPTDDLELRLGGSRTKTDVTYMSTMTLDEYESDPTQVGTAWGWPGYSTHQKYDSDVMNTGLKYDFNEKLSFNIDLTREFKESDYITYASKTTYEQNTMSANLNYKSDFYSLKMGVDGSDNSLDLTNSSVTNLQLSKTNKAAFIISQFYLNNLSLKAGYRYEKSKFEKVNDTEKNYNLNGIELGVNYLLDKQSSLFANYSHSYHSAEVDRLFSYMTGAFMGYVEPSKANSYTLGYSNISNRNKLKLSVFYIDMKNEIYYSPLSYTNKNIDESHKYGFELYNNYIMTDALNIVLNYNYVKSMIDKEVDGLSNYKNKQLPGVSNHNLKLTLNYSPTKNTTLSLTEVYRSEAYAAEDFGNSFSQKQDAYNTTDIAVTYIKNNYEFFAKVNNIFNQKNGIWIHDDAIYPMNYTTTAKVGFKLKY